MSDRVLVSPDDPHAVGALAEQQQQQQQQQQQPRSAAAAARPRLQVGNFGGDNRAGIDKTLCAGLCVACGWSMWGARDCVRLQLLEARCCFCSLTETPPPPANPPSV